MLIHLLCCSCNVASLACLQVIQHLPPDFQLNSLRFGIGLISAATVLIFKNQCPKIERKYFVWLSISIMSVLMYNITLYTVYVKALPLGALFGIRQGFVIILVALGSRVTMKLRFSAWQIFLMATTMVGLGFVIYSSFTDCRCHNKQSCAKLCNIISMSNARSGGLCLPSLFVMPTEHCNSKMEHAEFQNNMQMPYFELRNLTNIDHGEPIKNGTGEHTHTELLTLKTVGLSISLLAGNALFWTIECLMLTATTLKEVDSIVLTFWYLLFGTVSSIVTSLLIEDFFIPKDIIDRILCIIHCVTASLITFLVILALKFVHPNILSMVGTGQIPATIFIQMVLLQSVTPPVNVWILIVGTSIITLSVFGYSLHAILQQNRKDK